MNVRLKSIGIAAVATTAGAICGFSGTATDTADIEFLDVGQGDCSVIRDGNSAILVDVGPAANGFDAARTMILPKLRKHGISNVIAILITHPDLDHMGGLATVYKAFPNARVMVSKEFQRSEKMVGGLAAAGVSNPEWLPRETFLRFGKASVEVTTPFWPPQSGDNEGSLFIIVKVPGTSAIITGDAGIVTENAMAGQKDWRADVLHAGHHGSKNSTGQKWLKEVNPKSVVISCGLNNRYGHPHKDVLKRVEKQGAEVFRTDLNGDIVFGQK